MLLPTTEGGWSCCLADPPWNHAMRTPKGVTSRHASTHYEVMPIDEIRAMPVRSIVARDAHLFLWTTWPHLEQALSVIHAWGFTYSSNFLTWAKLNPTKAGAIYFEQSDFHVGTGYTSRKCTEVLLLGRRGQPQRLSRNTRELLISARRQHSRKPEETYARIEGYCPGPRLELFARERRDGWTSWGNQVDKFGEVAAPLSVATLTTAPPVTPQIAQAVGDQTRRVGVDSQIAAPVLRRKRRANIG